MTEKETNYYIEKIKQITKTIAPICDAANIKFSYEITASLSEILSLNGTDIFCTGKSVQAIRDEVIAYLFVTEYCRHRSDRDCISLQEIKREWRCAKCSKE